MKSKNWLRQIPSDIGYFMIGFVEGEGSFNVSIRPREDHINRWQPTLSFNVSQREITLLVLLKKYLGCGKLRKRKDGINYYEVSNPNTIIDKVVPFFKRFSFRSHKMTRNFGIFSEIADMMAKGEHLNEKGLKKIIRLREELNEGRGRKRKYQLRDYLESMGESSETIC